MIDAPQRWGAVVLFTTYIKKGNTQMSIAELIEAKPQPKSKADQHAYPDDLLRALGSDCWLTQNEVAYLLGNDFSAWLASAERNGKIRPSAVKLHGERHAPWRYRLSEIVRHIHESETPIRYEETAIGSAILDGEPAEAIDAGKDFTVAQIDQHFGIPEDKLDGKKLSIEKHPFKPWSVSGERLIEWITSANVKTVWSIDVAARIARRRREAGEQEQERTKVSKQKPSLLDTAFSAIEQAERDEAAKRAESRDKALTSYRLILARREKPKSSDAAELATLCRELGYDRDHVAADVASLDKIAELEQVATTIDASYAAMKATSDELAALQKRCKQELEQADIRQRIARSAVRAAQSAPGAIAELKRRHPELFTD